jgi:hypothetical protein
MYIATCRKRGQLSSIKIRYLWEEMLLVIMQFCYHFLLKCTFCGDIRFTKIQFSYYDTLHRRNAKGTLHCKDTITKIRNKYSQKRNCAASVGVPILLQENVWTDPENILIDHRHMNVEMGTEATQLLFWEYINGIFVVVWLSNHAWHWGNYHTL